MVESPDFSSRLDEALSMNGLTNAEFAERVGEKGQQKVNRWRSRGKIGQPSVPVVRDILRRTDMVWLQEGVGQPERAPESFRINDVRQSYAERLDLVILATAKKLLDIDEKQDGFYNYEKWASRLMELYSRLESGEDELALAAQLGYERVIRGQNEREQPERGTQGAASRR